MALTGSALNEAIGNVTAIYSLNPNGQGAGAEGFYPHAAIYDMAAQTDNAAIAAPKPAV